MYGALEITSPILHPQTWHKTLTYTLTWLSRHYTITGNNRCSTHVHISKTPPFDLRELKLIAQAVIYWEPAWEAVVPAERRRNMFAKSNYLDNAGFALAGRTRDQVIDSIGGAESVEDLLEILHPIEYGGSVRTKNWGWHFGNVRWDCGTIEFRRGSWSKDQPDIRKWIAVAVSFILAAVRAGSVAEIRRLDCTIPNLERFMLEPFDDTRHPTLSTKQVFEREDIERLFAGKRNRSNMRPSSVYEEVLTDRQRRMLKELTDGDVRRVRVDRR